jgi:hypothetical protein
MLGREADDAEGFIKLPIGSSNAQQSVSIALPYLLSQIFGVIEFGTETIQSSGNLFPPV